MNKGFTIIEIIVVISVFLFVIGAAMGIFISIVQNQKRTLLEQQLINQISYAEEYMSKALRMAKTAQGEGCIGENNIYELIEYNGDSGDQGIKFINQSDNDVCQWFFLEDGVLYEKKGDNGKVALTSNEIMFDSENPIRFLVNGSDYDSARGCSSEEYIPEDCVQPKVTILMNINIETDKQSRAIQTTVSRRNLNVYR